MFGDDDPESAGEWIALGVFERLKMIASEAYDRIVGLLLEDVSVDGCITKAPGGGEVAGRSPVDRGKGGMKRSNMVDGKGIPLHRVLAGANRHDSPLLGPALDKLDAFGPLPATVTVHLDAGYDSKVTRTSSKPANCSAKSPAKATRHPSRRVEGGMLSGRTPGTTPSTGCNAATNAENWSSTRSSTSPTSSSPYVA